MLGEKIMIKLPKNLYIHYFLMIAIFIALITALLTYILITAPIEHNQRVMSEAINYLITQCNFVEGTEPFYIFQNLTINFTQ